MSNKFEHEMYAVVSSTRALLLIELNSKRTVPLEWHRGEYYGMSWFPEADDLVLSHSLLDNERLVDIGTYARSEVGVLSVGPRETQGFLSQPHQIVCGSDGRVICTNTGRNAICIVDLTRPDIIQEARISAARWDRLGAENLVGDHLNSVFEKNGLLYVIAHGYSKGSALATFTYPDMQLIGVERLKHRSGLHNIWVTDEGQRIACHSDLGSLIELNSNSVLWESGFPMYSRGLAATPDFVLVGESQKSARDGRRGSMSGIWVLDRKTWQPMDYLFLGPYGGVHDVRLLNVPDEAHHCHVFAGTAALLARSSGGALAEARIAASKRRHFAYEAWKSFEVIFGSPEARDDGSLMASLDDLCLMTKAPTDAVEIGFEYKIEPSAVAAHVSVVAYAGVGSDTDMNAALIQCVSEDECRMSMWVHDGTRWAAESAQPILGLPLRGRVRLTRGNAGIQLDIDGRAIASELLGGMRARGGRLGVRWSGAALFPLRTDEERPRPGSEKAPDS